MKIMFIMTIVYKIVALCYVALTSPPRHQLRCFHSSNAIYLANKGFVQVKASFTYQYIKSYCSLSRIRNSKIFS